MLDKLPKAGYVVHGEPYKDKKRDNEFVPWELECWDESRFVSVMEKL